MKINSHNYESWFLDYFERNLTAQQEKELFLFLDENPTLKEEFEAFENISLDLSKQVTVLIGENGSGKSTILRAIALGITGTDFFDLDKDLQRERSEIFNGFLKINEYQKAIPKYTQEGSIVLSIKRSILSMLSRKSFIN